MASGLTTTAARLERLKEILQSTIKPAEFEKVVAALISEVLQVAIAISHSGFQHGADSGPSGRQNRRFRIETKRYADSTSLSDRELLGEIDHALQRDPALEAWFLVATRAAPEQLELDLMKKSDELGLPVVVIDWKPDTFPALAALCTAAPAVLAAMVSVEACRLAGELAHDAQRSLDSLRRDLAAWNLGFEKLRALGQQKLEAIWSEPRQSAATLGQNAAGGAYHTTIRRVRVQRSLDNWWRGNAQQDAPAAVIGWQGAGKTWATLQWTLDRVEEQPLVLVVASSAAAGIGSVSKAALKRFIGERLYDLTEARDPRHWQLRFDRLLRRPAAEGPVLTLVLDGMNQDPSVPWLGILKVLQDPEFAGRIRTIAVTRNLHFTDRLGHLRGLIIPADVINVDIYDLDQGGELDQRLAAEGLTRRDLHEDLVQIARTPRLFNLVIRLRDRLGDADQVTVHRLLWEYGRDTLGTRDGIPFSEPDWRGWLASVASQHLEGIKSYNLKTLGEMVGRPDLTATDVFRRLSEIVDGDFAKGSPTGRFELAPVLVAHALGTALLDHLEQTAPDNRDVAEKQLAEWLDPIAGLDEKAEILRAAISILLGSESSGREHLASTLVFEWLRSQNLPERHRTELFRIAAPLCASLLDVVERSGETAMKGAQLLAVNALRSISRDDRVVLTSIIERCRAWLCEISRDVDPPRRRNADSEKSRAARLMKHVGFDEDGEHLVLGHRLMFVERRHISAKAIIPTLLEGFPLYPALPVFEAAALSLAIRHYEDFWDGLKWLCLLNDRDFVMTTQALRDRAGELAGRKPEVGVHAELGARAGALLLWLSGDEDNERLAAEINPPLARSWDYEEHYLRDPGKSFFALEHRHALSVLQDTALSLHRRVERTKTFWLDPTFTPPETFVSELRQHFAGFDPNQLDAGLFHTPADQSWEEFSVALARCAPDLLADLTRSKLEGFATRSREPGYAAAVRSEKHYLVTDSTSREAATALRSTFDPRASDEQALAVTQLLILEIEDLPAEEQYSRIIEAGIKHIYVEFSDVLPALNLEEIDGLIERFGCGSENQASDLILLLSLAGRELSEKAWNWLWPYFENASYQHRGLVFQILCSADDVKFGRMLTQREWSWSPDQQLSCNHYGSLAVAKATAGFPFDQHAAAIAPWLLLRAVALRGGSAADAEVAAAILTRVVVGVDLDPPDLGSDISVSSAVREFHPFAISVTPRANTSNGPLSQLGSLMNSETQREAARRAVDTAVKRIDDARAAGADLYLHSLRPEDFSSILDYVPSAVDAWIAGYATNTADFRTRVILAEGFFLALCEALLTRNMHHGLWRALCGSLTTRFVGEAKVQQLIHMLFRAKDSTDALRADLLGLSMTNSDQDLFDLVLAAILNGEETWLDGVIAEDEASGVVWRRQRAGKLRAFRANNRLPVDAWPIGLADDSAEFRRREIVRWKRSEAFARHWWDLYWEAESDDDAYAAWQLLLSGIDRRAFIWMKSQATETSVTGVRSARRRRHVALNLNALKSAMKKSEKKLDEEFLGRKTVLGIGPWGKASPADPA